jgi:hypothetical protein
VPRLTSVLGYTGAALTILAAIAGPFVLYGAFTQGIAATGVRIDPVYSGGAPAREIARPGYRIVVYRPVVPSAPLSPTHAFVQLAWTPAGALPRHVEDAVDLDGDGRVDLVARFDVPSDAAAPLFLDVMPAGGRVLPVRHASRGSFTAMIARVGDRIVARIPLAPR